MREPVSNLLDSLLDEQKQSWLDGRRPAVEELLEGSSLQEDSEALLDLVYNEIVVREELGERPAVDEYTRRYPHLREEIELHFEVHRAVQDRLLIDTRRVRDEESVPELEVGALEPGPPPGDYELLGVLGQGGMGVVYKARHRRLKRYVALKMFQPGRLPSARELLRFQTEAQAVARLQHPNIVQIFEVGQWDGLPYLALELAEQATLAQKLQQLPFTPRTAAELIQTLARAVQYAHEQHIVHRDLKPANVLFTRDGSPKITDFGLAKILEDEAESPRDATRTGEPIGTPRYMAPEQAAGRQEQVGPATDVYGLGTLLYECLTGQVPFVAASVVETLEKIRADEPLSPRRLQPKIPRDLETICLNCLRKEPGRRYASARALADDLRRFLNGEPIQARRTSAWERAWKWCRRRPTQAALAGVGLVLLFSGLALFLVRDHVDRIRLAELRAEVAGLMKEGQEALLAQQVDRAGARFKSAWMKVQGEPALHDEQTHVAGWLDHARRAANRQLWKQSTPPREYDELRDEALLQSLLLDPHQAEPVRAARRAIADALEFTVAGDPTFRQEREQLALLDADLLFWEGDAVRALARLDQGEALASRLVHQRRAAYLERLGRQAEADRQRRRAAQFPPGGTYDLFLSGVERVRRRDLEAAVRDFDRVLDAEPEHFTARLFQAACFLRQGRPHAAKVALTACVAQRPRFAWSYLFRGQARLRLGEPVTAAEDYQRALELSPQGPARFALLAHVGLLPLQFPR